LAVIRARKAWWASRPRNAWSASRERLVSRQIEGITLYYPSRSTVGDDLLAGAGWPEAVREIVDGSILSEEPFLVDVGSNVGTTLLQFKFAKPLARVLCVEGSPRFLPALRATIAANGWTDVEVVEKLLGAEPGEAVLHSNTGTGSIVSRQYGPHIPVRDDRVQLTTLDQVLAGRPTPALIKSDTDGFEFDVLLGGNETLARLRPPLYFEFFPSLVEKSGRDPGDLPVYLRQLGYDCFQLLTSRGAVIGVERDPGRVLAVAVEHGYVDVLATSRR
jgi:FkbM family methyltransferase